MKATTVQLNALLASRQFYLVDLWTLTLVTATIQRFCSGDVDITDAGTGFVYSAGGVDDMLWKVEDDSSGDATWEVGTAAAQLTVSVAPRLGVVQSLPVTTALRYGVLDGATLTWALAVMPTYGNTGAGGVVPMFTGRIVDVSIRDQVVMLSVNSPMELLDQQLPRNLIQAPCINTLYDTACTLNPASFLTGVAVVAGSSTTTLLVSGAGARATGYFDQGKITLTSGPNPISRAVRRFVTGATASVIVYPPFPFIPSIGTTANLVAGCDKTVTTCNAKFANKVNFRGFPTVPQPENLV